MNGRRQNRWLSLVILLLIFSGMGLYFRANPALISSLRQISWPFMLLIILLRLLFLMLNGVMLKLFVSRFDVHLVWPEWVGLALVTTLGNYITPFSGGMLARATYLKVKHRLPFAQFASLMAASYVIIFGVAALMGLGCLLWLMLWQQSTLWQGSTLGLGLFFGLVLSGVLTAVLLPFDWLPAQPGRFMTPVKTVLEGWHRLRTDRLLLLQLTAVNIVSMLLNGLAFWLAYRALNFIEVTLPAAGLVSLTAVFSVILTITPDNLGIREVLVSLTSELIAIGVGEGLLVALLIRAGTLATVFTLGPLFSIWLSRRVEIKDGEK